MRLIVTHSIEKMAEKVWLSFDDIYDFIKTNRPHWFIKLCSPIEWTIAYKWYVDNLKRIIVFAVDENGIIYPVYIWDKQDQIAKNITVDIVRKNADKWHSVVEKDLENRKLKIRHF